MFKPNKTYLKISILIGFILLIPLIAMQFTTEVNWTFLDFLAAGILLFSTAIVCEFAILKIKKRQHKILICLMILIMLLLIWAELAVGVFGTIFSGS